MILLNCPVCGTPIPNGSQSCPACGTPVSTGAPAGFGSGQSGFGGPQQGGFGSGYGQGGYSGGYNGQQNSFKANSGYASWFKILSWVFAGILLVYAIYYGFMIGFAPFGGWLIGFEDIQTLYTICLVCVFIGFILMIAGCVLIALEKTGKITQMILILVGWLLILVCACIMEAQLSGVALPMSMYGTSLGTNWFVYALVNTLVPDIAAIAGLICLFLQKK